MSATGVTAIVLAGGRSTRFGADKLAVEVDGRPLLHHPIEAVAPLADEVLVVVAPGAAPTLPQDVPARLVHDPRQFGGPLVGLEAALAETQTPIALVVAGDMPSLVPAVLQRLLATVTEGRPAVILEVIGRVQPLPMALDVAVAHGAARTVLERGGRSLRDLLAELGASVVPAPAWLALDPTAATIRDIDRPSDLHP